MALGSFGVGLAGLAGAFDAEQPKDRSLNEETTANLEAQIGLAPLVYQNEATYQPRYAQLGLDTLRQTLLGGGVTPRQEEYTDYETRQVAKQPGMVRAPGYGNWQSGITQYATEKVPVTKTRTVYDQKPEGNGLLDLMGIVAERNRQEQTKDRQALLGDADLLAGRLPGIYREANPGGANLLDMLMARAQGTFDKSMSPGELRDVQQAIRSGQADRGVGYGPRDQWEEVYGTGLQSRALQQENVNNAMNALTASQNFYGNPFTVLFQKGGPGSEAISNVTSEGNVLGATAPKLFNPESSYGANLNAQNYAGALSTNLTNAQLRAKYAQMTAEGGDSISKALTSFI